MIPRTIPIMAALFLGIAAAWGQRGRIDSLRAVIASDPTDTSAVHARLALCMELNYVGDTTHMGLIDTTIGLAAAAGLHPAHAQALLEKGRLLLAHGKTAQALEQLRAGEALAVRHGLLREQGDALFLFAKVHGMRSEHAAALEMYGRALSIFEELGLSRSQANMRFQQGVTLGRLGRFEESILRFHEALAVYESIGDADGIGLTLNNLGVTYEQFFRHAEALGFYRRALDHVRHSHRRKEVATVLSNIGRMHQQLGNMDSALHYMRVGLSELEAVNNRPDRAFGLMLYGEELQAMGRPAEAEAPLRQALDIFRDIGSRQYESQALVRLAEVVTLGGRREEGIALAGQALAAARETRSMSETLGAHEVLARLHEDAGDAGSALFHHKAHTALKDSLVNVESAAVLDELRTRYETEKKDRLLIEQDLLLVQGRAALERRGKVLWGTGIGAAALAAIAMLAWRDRRRHARLLGERMRRLESEQEAAAVKALLEGEERERQRVAGELHDGIGLLLSAARMRVDTDTPGGREKAGAILAEAASEVRRISHALMPGTLAKLGLPDALHELADGLNGSGRLRVEMHAHGFRERPSATVETGLYRIVQEALNNTVKHAHATTATVDLSVEDGRLVSLVVTDDGQGFDATGSGGNGHGTDNIRSRAALLGGTAVVRSAPGQGTQWEVSIPLHA